jgi:hypothetical protein
MAALAKIDIEDTASLYLIDYPGAADSKLDIARTLPPES